MEIVWNNDVKPPEGTQRAKDGKMGWYLEKDGTRHTLDRCNRKEDTVFPQVNEYEFVVPQAETTPEITAAVKTVKSVMAAADAIVRTHYPKLTNENVRGQIRSRLVDQLLVILKANK